MATTLRSFIADKAGTSQDVTVGLLFAVAGTDGEVYVLETNPLDPVLPTGITVAAFNTQFLRNGVDQIVTQDTANAANNRPLPVTLLKDGDDIEYGIGPADASTQRVVEATYTPIGVAVNNNSSVNITTAAYVQLFASTSAVARAIEVSDTGGRWLYIAIGAAAAEVDILAIPPGGSQIIPVQIAAGTRISVKAIDGTANTGLVGVNLYG